MVLNRRTVLMIVVKMTALARMKASEIIGLERGTAATLFALSEIHSAVKISDEEMEGLGVPVKDLGDGRKLFDTEVAAADSTLREVALENEGARRLLDILRQFANLNIYDLKWHTPLVTSLAEALSPKR